MATENIKPKIKKIFQANKIFYILRDGISTYMDVDHFLKIIEWLNGTSDP